MGSKLFNGHKYLADEKDVAVVILTLLLKQLTEQETKGLRKIFDEVKTALPHGFLLTFTKVETRMNERRQSVKPGIIEHTREASIANELDFLPKHLERSSFSKLSSLSSARFFFILIVLIYTNRETGIITD